MGRNMPQNSLEIQDEERNRRQSVVTDKLL